MKLREDPSTFSLSLNSACTSRPRKSRLHGRRRCVYARAEAARNILVYARARESIRRREYTDRMYLYTRKTYTHTHRHTYVRFLAFLSTSIYVTSTRVHPASAFLFSMSSSCTPVQSSVKVGTSALIIPSSCCCLGRPTGRAHSILINGNRRECIRVSRLSKRRGVAEWQDAISERDTRTKYTATVG